MNDERLEGILKGITAEEIPAEVRDIAQEVSDNFSRSLQQPVKFPLLELIMRSRAIKLAAAAVVIIAVLLGLPFLSDKTTSVSLAEVLENVEQAKAFMYRMKMHIAGAMIPGTPEVNQDMETTAVISNEFGMKMETVMTDPNTGEETIQQMFVVPEDKMMVMVMPGQKKYMRMEFSDDLLDRMKKQNNDPREMIKQMMGAEYVELGRSEIDGVEVEGFETANPEAYISAMGLSDVRITLWVDSASRLPVLVEMDMKMGDKMHIKGAIYDYQWDIPVTKDQFVPVIPDDYEAFGAEGLKMPEMSEEAAIEGLKFFADLAGRYPKSIDMVGIMQDLKSIQDERTKDEMSKEMTGNERVTKMMDKMKPIMSIYMFHLTLIQEQKEPVYYGQSVTPDDIGAVLMRWKISDDQYRVIFGDLSAMDVSADELSRLENPSE